MTLSTLRSDSTTSRALRKLRTEADWESWKFQLRAYALRHRYTPCLNGNDPAATGKKLIPVPTEERQLAEQRLLQQHQTRMAQYNAEQAELRQQRTALEQLRASLTQDAHNTDLQTRVKHAEDEHDEAKLLAIDIPQIGESQATRLETDDEYAARCEKYAQDNADLWSDIVGACEGEAETIVRRAEVGNGHDAYTKLTTRFESSSAVPPPSSFESHSSVELFYGRRCGCSCLRVP